MPIVSQSLLACQATTLLKSCLKCIVQHELAGWELISLAHYCAMSYSITHPVASLSSHLSMTVCMLHIQHETMKMPCSLTYGGSLISTRVYWLRNSLLHTGDPEGPGHRSQGDLATLHLQLYMHYSLRPVYAVFPCLCSAAPMGWWSSVSYVAVCAQAMLFACT